MRQEWLGEEEWVQTGPLNLIGAWNALRFMDNLGYQGEYIRLRQRSKLLSKRSLLQTIFAMDSFHCKLLCNEYPMKLWQLLTAERVHEIYRSNSSDVGCWSRQRLSTCNISFFSLLLQVYSELFRICCPRVKKVWFLQGDNIVYPPDFTLQSLGRSRIWSSKVVHGGARWPTCAAVWTS